MKPERMRLVSICSIQNWINELKPRSALFFERQKQGGVLVMVAVLLKC